MKNFIKRILSVLLPEKAYNIIRKYTGKARRSIYRIVTFKRKLDTPYKTISFGDKSCDTFFGYYDIIPFNEHNEVVYLECPKDKNFANIVYNKLGANRKRILTSTKAWNTQQGSRLRWFPESNDTIVFNDHDGEKYYSRIINIRTNVERKLDFPIYDISNDGKQGISLNFARLGKMRPGYGYDVYPYNEPKSLANEGIDLINIENGECKRVVTYEQIQKKTGRKISDFHSFYINHLSFSPDGNRFLFFWLEITKHKHKASLFVFDICENQLHLLEDDMKVSHYTWQNNESIISTAYDEKFNCQYYKYFIEKPKEIISPSILNKDGHPTFLSPEILLTDTYPNRYSYQQLFIADIKNGKKTPIANVYSVPVKKEELRTDLHPRLNYTKDIISFDANVHGYRRLYFLLDWKNQIKL